MFLDGYKLDRDLTEYLQRKLPGGYCLRGRVWCAGDTLVLSQREHVLSILDRRSMEDVLDYIRCMSCVGHTLLVQKEK